ncbi:MAG: BamA/TamA family outer membrane protein [Gammaproteobacteria bacterium]|nr:BamA/TamA family outer membrane protein [Gammaproteobacteria bacterium]
MIKWIAFVLSLLFSSQVLTESLSGQFEWLPDRRKDQFPTESAHLFVPLPYSYPGIGEGFFLIGYGSNLGGTTMDGVVIGVTGDATGNVVQFDEIPIIEDTLLMHIYLQEIDRAVVNNYEIRGMDDSSAFNLLDVTRADESRFQLQYTMEQRRINFYLTHYAHDFEIDLIRDEEGVVLQDFSPNYAGSTESTQLAVKLDFTDDYLDPRRGFKFELTYMDAPPVSANDPDYYKLDYDFQFYIPFFSNDVVVMNYYQSDAHVREAGNTNAADIISELGLNCGADPDCLTIQNQLVQNTINDRANGSATSLGGLERLRSYPQSRFQGGHMAFVGVEYRWNMADEETPFDYFIWKDVRTGKQIAFFAEIGTVSETSDEIWNETRSSVGVGFRLVTASGSVYRADIASGEEGSEMSVFFFYPW